jgi:hypothetical protein
MKIKVHNSNSSRPVRVKIASQDPLPVKVRRFVAAANARMAKVRNCDGIFVRQS